MDEGKGRHADDMLIYMPPPCAALVVSDLKLGVVVGRRVGAVVGVLVGRPLGDVVGGLRGQAPGQAWRSCERPDGGSHSQARS